MDLDSYYEIDRTASFIYGRNFKRVALQFPDENLKDATRVVRALGEKLSLLRESDSQCSEDARNVRLFVMADTTYGGCCVDEVGASHVAADCVIHYGHTCLSPTSTLPALFIFGKAHISVANCAEILSHFILANQKPVVVLYGLEYAHAIGYVKKALTVTCGTTSISELQFADVMCSVMDPPNDCGNLNSQAELDVGFIDSEDFGVTKVTRFKIGGLTWNIPLEGKIEDYRLFWIGSDNAAYANLILTLNGCEIVRYDATRKCLVPDVSQQKRILKRRYYLVERAKDANIIGILVGTLGVAGFRHMICQMKDLITRAGKKAYTFVMGRPNPAKLANFPECDVFIFVSCAQTALLDSKEYLVPVITPFEALLAYNRGSQWTGAYVMEFRNLMTLPLVEDENQSEEARFSFLKGGYVEDLNVQENGEEDCPESLALAHATEKALKVHENFHSVIKGVIKSGAEFYATRSYQGLEMPDNSSPLPVLVGRSGRASLYEDEKTNMDKA